MPKPFNEHHPTAGRQTDWLTPPDILEALHPLAEPFDLDPCAAPEPRPWPTAREHYWPPQDGLAKLAAHGRGTALIPARTDTEGFHEQVWQRAHGILFLRGRLHFYYPDGTRAAANSGAPSCLVAYGGRDCTQLALFGLPGYFVHIEDHR